MNCNDGYSYEGNNHHRRAYGNCIEQSKVHTGYDSMITTFFCYIIKQFCQVSQFVKPIDNPNISLIRTKDLSEYKECDSISRVISQWKPYKEPTAAERLLWKSQFSKTDHH